MDRALLGRVVAEIAGRLIDREVERVSFLGPSRYFLRFAGPDHPNLLISVRPELPRLHLAERSGVRREPHPDPFAALLDRDLAGARLVRLDQPEGDRLIDLTFGAPDGGPPEGGRRLVVELFGRRANAFLLDPLEVILGAAHDPGGVPRRMAAGGAYRAPVLKRDLEPEGASTRSPASAGEGATVLSPRPLGDYREGDRVDPGEFRVVAGRVTTASAVADGSTIASASAWFETASEAAEALYGLLERLLEFDTERERLTLLARREGERLERLDRNLAQDLEKAAGADRHRRYGEAILAGLRDARVTGDRASLPDPESVDGARIEVPIDPASSLQENAQRHFALWKKGRRGEAAIAARRAVAAERRAAWEAIAAGARAAADAAGLEAVRARMETLGLVHAAPRPKRAARPTRPEATARVRRHTTRDGFVILVGRSGAENDTLTFKVASPWDFWLHAAGAAGAHVIVRNPAKAGALPEGTLRTAAAIAAYYSDARADAHVEVHYTQRKHVRKGRGMPAGQVLLKRSKSIRVEPRLPDRAFDEP